MKKISKYLGIGVLTFALIANLQYALFSYGLKTNNLSMPLMAQTSSGSSSGGASITNTPPQGCGTATIHATSHEINDTDDCHCDVSWSFVLSIDPLKTEIHVAHNTGIQNTCKSGQPADSCDAYGCSSIQI